jgi:hypothetical protein
LKKKSKLFFGNKLRTGRKQIACEPNGIIFNTPFLLYSEIRISLSRGMKSSDFARTYAGEIGKFIVLDIRHPSDFQALGHTELYLQRS